jgi:serine/threonine protein kinase
MTLTAGTKLGRYEIRAQLGAGGMGEVYLAHDTRLDRKVALKILPADVAANQERMRRFTQEAKAAAALNHPNPNINLFSFATDHVTQLATIEKAKYGSGPPNLTVSPDGKWVLYCF